MNIIQGKQAERDGRNDFNFLFGTWRVHNRRLRERLNGCDDWEMFEGISIARSILDGMGNMDEITMERESGRAQGMTLRLYNPVSGEWSLHWANNTSGTLFPPMVGKFENGVGEFYAHETHEGKHVYSRFIWSDITETACRWEQALSPDGGKTWETNWVMEMERTR